MGNETKSTYVKNIDIHQEDISDSEEINNDKYLIKEQREESCDIE